MMNKLVAALLLAIVAPAVVLADDHPAGSHETAQDARVVPAMRGGKPEGLKVYAIRAGGKLDRPGARFQNGDTIVKVDGKAVTEDAGRALFQTKVIEGKGDGIVNLIRKGAPMELAIKGE